MAVSSAKVLTSIALRNSTRGPKKLMSLTKTSCCAGFACRALTAIVPSGYRQEPSAGRTKSGRRELTSGRADAIRHSECMALGISTTTPPERSVTTTRSKEMS